MLEDLQFLEQYKAGRVGRRLEHGKAAVVDRDRLLSLCVEVGEIGRRYRGPDNLETPHQPPRQGAAIKGFGALRGDFFERAGEILLYDRSTDRRRIVVD